MGSRASASSWPSPRGRAATCAARTATTSGRRRSCPKARAACRWTSSRRYIAQRLEASGGPVGALRMARRRADAPGPGLLPLDRRGCSGRTAGRGGSVSNGLQTNGCAAERGLGGFPGPEGFSVGLSLDGPAELHDAFRRARRRRRPPTRGSSGRSGCSGSSGVFVNVLCVLHARNAAEPDRVYDFFRGLGATSPPVPPPGEGSAGGACAADPEAVGAFLCRVFDRWIGRGRWPRW